MWQTEKHLKEQRMIPKMLFGRTGHMSSRTIFGAVALDAVTQDEADRTFALLEQYSINHIDVARSYGDAELRVGSWMKRHRADFFLATKTEKRTKDEAFEELEQSLERLQTDHVDLWQLHCLVEPDEWEIAMGEGGALEAAIEARRQGLTTYIGVTGHGITAPHAHLNSLARFDFDSVLFPYNYLMMRQQTYAKDVEALLRVCRKKNVAVQTIKSLARRNWREKPQRYRTWYEPLDDANAIDKAVRWVLGNEQVFLNTTGDIQLLPHILKAAASQPLEPVSDEEMEQVVKLFGMEPLFA